MRHVTLSAIAIALVMGLAAAQDMPKMKKAKPCDQKKLEDAVFCPLCGTVIEDEDKHAADEASKDHKTEKCKLCVKKFYSCDKCSVPSDKPGKCCGEEKKEQVDKSRVALRCEGCGTPGEKEGKCAQEFCKKEGNRVKMMCTKSGTWPHGGILPQKPK